MTHQTSHQTYTLQRTGSAPLTFQGELLAEAGTREGGDTNRWHELELYQCEHLYVVAIHFHTCWKGEDNRHWVHLCADLGAVRDVLEAHEPIPDRVGFPRHNDFADRQRNLEQALRTQYDLAVSQLLEEFPVTIQELSEQNATDHYAELDARAITSWARAKVAALRLTRDEACAIADANNGSILLDEHPGLSVCANIVDTENLASKWQVDCRALAARITAADQQDRATQFALAWCCAQFWRRANLDTDQALHESGLWSSQ